LQIRAGGTDDREEALRIIQQSLDAGCNFIDTAPAGVVQAIDALWERELKDNPLPW
jgi:predicted aldo/keto reductase-like oxidoreductase